MHTLLKYVHDRMTMNLLSKKGVTVGTIDFEFGVTYGSFGYGQSYQLKTDMYTTQVRLLKNGVPIGILPIGLISSLGISAGKILSSRDFPAEELARHLLVCISSFTCFYDHKEINFRITLKKTWTLISIFMEFGASF